MARFTMDRTLNEDELVGFYIRVWKGENVSGIKRAMNSRQEAVYNSTGLHGCQADLRLGCRVSRGAQRTCMSHLSTIRGTEGRGF